MGHGRARIRTDRDALAGLVLRRIRRLPRWVQRDPVYLAWQSGVAYLRPPQAGTALRGFRRGRGIIGAIAASGIGEIINDVDDDARRVTGNNTVKALIVAPLEANTTRLTPARRAASNTLYVPTTLPRT